MSNWKEGLTPEQIAEMMPPDREQLIETYDKLMAEAMSVAEAGGPVEPPVLGVHGGRKPIYVYMGHASDLLVEDPEHPGSYKPDKTKNVPDGCTYSTISETGKTTTNAEVFTINKLFNNPVDRLLFYEPGLSVVNIHTRLKRMNPDIEFHVTDQGKSYTNSRFTFLSDFEMPNGSVILCKSGIYDISLPNPPHLPDSVIDLIDIPDGKVKFDHIRKIYEGSIFPTAQDIISTLLGMRPELTDAHGVSVGVIELVINMLLKERGYKTQEELFKFLPPGNHYNIACRSFDKKKPVNEGVLAGARGISRHVLEELGGNHFRHAESNRVKNQQKAAAAAARARLVAVARQFVFSYFPMISQYAKTIKDGRPRNSLRPWVKEDLSRIKSFLKDNNLSIEDLGEDIKATIITLREAGIDTNIRGGKRTKKKRVSKKKSRKRF